MNVDPRDLEILDGPKGAALSVRVVPRAGRSKLSGIRQGALLVHLAAAPVKGAANQVLTLLLSTVLDVPRTRVRVISGEHARQKRLMIEGLSAAEVVRRLVAAL